MKKLVIIGGGFAGSRIAKKLECDFEVTFVDNKDYFEFTPGILRSIANPNHLSSIEVCHGDYLKKSKVLNDTLIGFKRKSVLLKNEGKVDYDFLVLSMGSSYTFPIKSKNTVLVNRGRDIMSYHDKIASSKKVLIIGGGLVGVELAAEIIEVYSHKSLTLIHAGKELLERNNKRAREYSKKFLEKRGVKLVLGERVQRNSGKFVKTDKGKKYEYDLCIMCTGIKPNSDKISKKFLDRRGFVKVNKSLQLNNMQNIFVCGDLASVSEEKTAQAAKRQADVVIKNLKNLSGGRNLKEYRTKKRPMVISLGKWNGILELNNFDLPGLIPAFLKWIIEKKTMLKYKKLF